MKKFLSLITIITMLLTCSTDVFAAPSPGDFYDVKFYYNLPTEYKWSVPQSAVNANGGSLKVEVTKNFIEYGKKLTISVVSENNWKLVDTENVSNKLDYAVKVNDVAWTNNQTVLSINAGTSTGSVTGSLSVEKETVERAGIYSDKLTFTANIVDQEGE